MNAYASEGLYNEEEELLQAMQRDGCSPDAPLVTVISMQRDGTSPTCAHFSHLMSTYTREGLITEAERMYKELLSADLCPDLAYNCRKR
ncbi:Pentatricopeptide repeat [Dillenia turbinata]|uniref:Pentatricopeptide repeat n=1 Tax=Dillenia turbinata TaxID=194707 RepID=A0AAN8Z5Z8_9MAGN